MSAPTSSFEAPSLNTKLAPVIGDNIILVDSQDANQLKLLSIDNIGFLPLDGTKSMTGTLNLGGQDLVSGVAGAELGSGAFKLAEDQSITWGETGVGETANITRNSDGLRLGITDISHQIVLNVGEGAPGTKIFRFDVNQFFLEDVPVRFSERAGDPVPPSAVQSQLYTKDVSGAPELFFQNSGGVIQITGTGSQLPDLLLEGVASSEILSNLDEVTLPGDNDGLYIVDSTTDPLNPESKRLSYVNLYTSLGIYFVPVTGGLFSGDVIFDSNSSIRFNERADDPGGAADAGFVYTKEVSGQTELFYQNQSIVTQITGPGGAGNVVGPGPTVENESIAVFDGTGGLTIKNTTAKITNGNEMYDLDSMSFVGSGSQIDDLDVLAFTGLQAANIRVIGSQWMFNLNPGNSILFETGNIKRLEIFDSLVQLGVGVNLDIAQNYAQFTALAAAPSAPPAATGRVYVKETTTNVFDLYFLDPDDIEHNLSQTPGGGDVVGPDGGTQQFEIALFDDSSGKVITNSQLAINATQIREASSNNELLVLTPVIDAVNFLQVINSIAGQPITVQSAGDMDDVGLRLAAKGTASVFVQSPMDLQSNDTINQGVQKFVHPPTSIPAASEYYQWVDTNGSLVLNAPVTESIELRVNNLVSFAVSMERINVTNHFVDFQTLAGTPAAPPTGFGRLYVRETTPSSIYDLYYLDDQDIEHNLSQTSGGGDVVGPDGGTEPLQIALFDDNTGKVITNSELTINGTQIRDANTNELLVFTPVASAVNFLQVLNAASGQPVVVQAAGDDANVGLNLLPKGESSVMVGTAEFFNLTELGPTVLQKGLRLADGYIDEAYAMIFTTHALDAFVPPSTTEHIYYNPDTLGPWPQGTFEFNVTNDIPYIFQQNGVELMRLLGESQGLVMSRRFQQNQGPNPTFVGDEMTANDGNFFLIPGNPSPASLNTDGVEPGCEMTFKVSPGQTVTFSIASAAGPGFAPFKTFDGQPATLQSEQMITFIYDGAFWVEKSRSPV